MLPLPGVRLRSKAASYITACGLATEAGDLPQ